MTRRTGAPSRNPKRAARTMLRRQQRAAREAAARHRDGGVTMLVAPTDGSQPHVFDACPMCKAMADLGLVPDSQGVVRMSAEQHEQLRQRQRVHIERDGLPDGAVRVSGDGLTRTFNRVQSTLAEHGDPTDISAMNEREFAIPMERAMEIIDAEAVVSGAAPA